MEQAASDVFFTRSVSPGGVMKAFESVRHLLRGKVGIKTHFGERGNHNYLRPSLSQPLVEATGGTYIETCVLYVGPRHTPAGHLAVAAEHGFSPVDIIDADGDLVLPYPGKHYREVHLGAGIDRYDTLLLFTHVKGHMMAGMGGAIKNAGMGLSSVAGKMAQHASKTPHLRVESCVECGLCVGKCPGAAIAIKPVRIDPGRCVGCGACIGVCPQQVFEVPWESTRIDVFQERMAEYADAVRRHRNCVCVSVLANISAHCDCLDGAPAPFMPDVGILASADMLAIDQAAYDLVNRAYGKGDAFLREARVSGEGQLVYGEQIGLGNRRYNLIELD